MVEALVVCFFFSLSLSGWGHFIWKLLFSDRPSIPDSLLFGMIFTAQLGLWLHFFTPLSPLIVVTMTIVGILFFIKDYFFKNQNKFPKKIFFLTGLIGFLLMVGYALDSNLYSDVVGYHFPALNWMIHQKIIFGLANLQDRFGFNSIWYIISALSNPLMRWQSSVEYGSIALLWIYFMSGFYLPKGIQALGWICRAVAFILWGKQAFLINLGLPATDLPSALCCLIFYERIFISYNQNKLEYYKLLQIIFIYIFAVQLKLSQIFLGLPLLALVFSFRKEAFLSEAKNWWRYLIFVFGMIFPWALRTYFLSGCWLFPIAKSCFPVVISTYCILFTYDFL